MSSRVESQRRESRSKLYVASSSGRLHFSSILLLFPFFRFVHSPGHPSSLSVCPAPRLAAAPPRPAPPRPVPLLVDSPKSSSFSWSLPSSPSSSGETLTGTPPFRFSFFFSRLAAEPQRSPVPERAHFLLAFFFTSFLPPSATARCQTHAATPTVSRLSKCARSPRSRDVERCAL